MGQETVILTYSPPPPYKARHDLMWVKMFMMQVKIPLYRGAISFRDRSYADISSRCRWCDRFKWLLTCSLCCHHGKY